MAVHEKHQNFFQAAPFTNSLILYVPESFILFRPRSIGGIISPVRYVKVLFDKITNVIRDFAGSRVVQVASVCHIDGHADHSRDLVEIEIRYAILISNDLNAVGITLPVMGRGKRYLRENNVYAF